MIESLRIEGFRGHQERVLKDLARVSLLVGRNNSGKTAVLDAVELLMRDGHPRILTSLAGRRSGEYPGSFNERAGDSLPLTVRYLFHGYGDTGKTSFSLASTGNPARKLEVTWEEFEDDEDTPAEGATITVARDNGQQESFGVGDLRNIPRVGPITPPQRRTAWVQFVSPLGATASSLVPLWNSIVGNPEEEQVLTAMQILDDRIDRIVFSTEAGNESYPNIFVRLKGVRERVPLSTLGDGMRRLLGIAIRAVKSQDGFLLLDEVDSGLHFSAMSQLWKWLCTYAEAANIQIFATTHNVDCLNALGWLHRSDPKLTESTALFRIDPAEVQATRYSPDELRIVAEQALEVRT